MNADGTDGADPRSGGSAARVASDVQPELSALRSRIDAVDRDLVRLLCERARLGIEIGHVKAAAGLDIFDPDRERDVLDRVRALDHEPIPDEDLADLYRRIIALTRRLEGSHRG